MIGNYGSHVRIVRHLGSNLVERRSSHFSQIGLIAMI